jgi:hypothetical protein
MGVERERADPAHVAGQDDGVGMRPGQDRGERVVRARGGDAGLDPLRLGPLEARAGPVGEDEDDLSADVSTSAGGDERPKVRSLARNPDGDPAGRRARGGRPRVQASTWRPASS